MARDRIVVRRLVDEDENTPPFEVHWLADEIDRRAPKLCHESSCEDMTRHAQGRFSYSQVCESMRTGTIRMLLDEQGTQEAIVKLEMSHRPMFTLKSLERSSARVELVFSEAVQRARFWIDDAETSHVVESVIDRERASVTLPESCAGGECSLWAHVARLSHQEQTGDVLIDHVDEIHAKLPGAR